MERGQPLPSLIDFGDEEEEQEPRRRNPGDGWAQHSASKTPPSSSIRSEESSSTPLRSSPSPDLLTGDFDFSTPPTSIPGVPPPFLSYTTSPPSVSSAAVRPHGGIFRHSQSFPELSSSSATASASDSAPPPSAPTNNVGTLHGGNKLALHGPTSSEGSIPVNISHRRLSPQALPPLSKRRPSEFLAAGGGKGVFKAPLRGPVDPDRPVPFDLRPSPMRNHQPARALACTSSSLWLACDGAFKVWDVGNAMGDGSGGEGNPPDDIDAASFTYLSVEGVILCLVADPANELVWSGHRDGRVRAWSTIDAGVSKRRAEPSLCWFAHRSPVLAMVITSYGELWTGSDAGAIRAWPWEAAAHSLCRAEEDHSSAASAMARSYVDLRARGTAAGATSLGTTDVLFLVSEHTNGRVWSGGLLALALWDARTRDVLKVFGPSVQSEFSSPDISPVRDNLWDDSSMKGSKKEKTGPLSFFQRVIGAADAVRRAAGGGQAGDESKKLDALIAAVDGSVWGGYASGMIIQWDSLGNRLQELLYVPVPIRSLCAVGTRIWVGYADGRIQVLGDTGKVLGIWIAHSSAIIRMAKCGSYVFTLADHGGIRGWNIGSPCPIDGILQIEMQSKAEGYTQERSFKVLAGTWNVAEEKASLRSMQLWLSAASHAGVVFVGLQETEMSAGAIAMAAAKETVSWVGGLQEKSSGVGQWWLDNLGAALGEGQEFVRVGSRQLAGILIGVWVRNELVPFVGEVDAAAVPCGFGRALGNKGAVGVKLLLFRRTFCFLSSHFAAHMDAVSRRNADFEHIFHQMKFGRSTGAPAFRGATVRRTGSPESQETGKDLMIQESETIIEAVLPDLADADMIVWVGDFNYRIDDLTYEDVIDSIAGRQWDVLLPKDQLRAEMAAGRVFQGMREGSVRFQPTYKFDKGYNNALGYDSSEKKRVPAWCDRVIFRDSYDGTDSKRKSKLAHPVSASVISYDSCMEVVDSDHKPVRCLLNVDIAVINEASRRRAFCELMQSNAHVQKWVDQLNSIPETVVSTNKLLLEDGVPSVLKAINESSRQCVLFEMFCEGDPGEASGSGPAKLSLRAGYGFPLWLQVVPASGMIPPKASVEITLKYVSLMPDESMEGARFGGGDSRGKVVRLVFSFRGSLSSFSKQYRVSVWSPSTGQAAQEQEPKFRLARSNVLASRLNSHDTKDLLL